MDELLRKLENKELTVNDIMKLNKANLDYIHAIKRIINSTENKKTISVDSKSLHLWLESTIGSIVGRSISEVYLEYCRWCIENEIEAIGKQMATKELCKEFTVMSKVCSVGGKSTRLYVKY